jgi:hypothetical protein
MNEKGIGIMFKGFSLGDEKTISNSGIEDGNQVYVVLSMSTITLRVQDMIKDNNFEVSFKSSTSIKTTHNKTKYIWNKF